MSARPRDRSKSSDANGSEPAFVFKDRSGKVHGIGRKSEATTPAATTVRPADQQPTPRGRALLPDAPDIRSRYAVDGAPKNRDRKLDRKQKKIKGRIGKPDREHDRRDFKSKRKAERARPLEGGRSGSGKWAKAIVDKNRKGFAFLIFEDRKIEDGFVPPGQADRLFHGDRVEVLLDRRGKFEDLRVIGHRFREVVGRFQRNPSWRTGEGSKGAWVIYERKRAREEIFAPAGHPTAQPGDWVRAQLKFTENEDSDSIALAVIVEVYGKDIPPSADVTMVAAEYNLIEAHSSDAIHEARQYKLDLELTHREDLREVPFITIDGETARDFDDAVYVERSKSGFVLWVAIADVSHYVKPGTALDAEARERGTSVYFPERAFHMLPGALSENLCSLRPNEPRLVLVAKMEYDRLGKRQSTEVMEAIIESRRRATYNEIANEIDKYGKNPDWELKPQLDLYRLLRRSRNERGSIDFDLPESEIVCQPTGEVVSIKNRARNDAHRLIEEFMIAANEAVTEWALERHWPFIYRIHDEPSAQSLVKFQELAQAMGVAVRVDASKGNLRNSLNQAIRDLEEHPAQGLLNMALLRAMKQAVYSAVHGQHFGLASQAYTHFTSPIRRYPDLLVHRMLRLALRAQKKTGPMPSRKEIEEIEKSLGEDAEHCSYRERLAADAERETIKLKQVRIMIPKVGEEFDCKVTGMHENGLFVTLDDPFVEGMVSVDTLNDDTYQFDERQMLYIGRRKGLIYRIGDRLRVVCASAKIDTRQIEFTLVEGANAKHEKAQAYGSAEAADFTPRKKRPR